MASVFGLLRLIYLSVVLAGPEQIRKSGGSVPTIRDIGATNDQIGLTQDDTQKHRDRLFFLRFWQPISNRTSDFLLKRQRQEPVATVSLSRTISIMDDQKWHRIVPVGYPSNNPSNNYKKLGGSWCSSISGVSQRFHSREDRILATGGPRHES